MSIIFETMGVTEAAKLMAAREMSPVELLRVFLDRITAVNHALQSFVTVVEERALADAHAAEKRFMEGGPFNILLGIPYGLKDIFETAGIRTTAHSKLLADYIPTEDCFVQQQLAAAGGVLIGKTATWEFAFGGPSFDILFPPARNPWDLARDPSGSSSGSAAAVASGLCLVAMGSDTGRSIRGPAAACGIVGLKPTSGRVSRRGVLTNSTTYDHCGPMGRSVEDVAAMLQVISAQDKSDPYSSPEPAPLYYTELIEHPLDDLRDMVVGIPWDWIEDQVRLSPVLDAVFRAAIRVFADAGAQIRTVTLPPISAYEDTQKVIQAAEIFSFYGTALRETPEMFGDNFRYRVLPGALLRAEDYVNALKIDSLLKHKTREVLDTVDCIITPVQEAADFLKAVHPEVLYTTPGYLSSFALAGVPAIVLPMGYTHEFLPLGLQIATPRFTETRVLRIAHFYQQATRWFDRLRQAATAAESSSRKHPSARREAT